MIFKRKRCPAPDLDAALSPRADRFLREALEEFSTKQANLESEWGFGQAASWDIDQGEGIFRMYFDDGRLLEADAQLLGSYSHSEKNLEWAWNNPNVFLKMKRDSRRIRKAGKDLGIDYLQAGFTPVLGEEFLSYLCSLGLKATDSEGVYRGSAGPVDVLLLLKNLRWAVS